MDNLVVTTATFGTSDLVSTGTEFYPHVSQAQVAQNTGFNYYLPKYLVRDADGHTVSAQGTGTDVGDQFYLGIGKFAIYGRIWTSGSNINPAGTAKFAIDGTTLVEYASGADWAGTTLTFTGTISPTTRGWTGGVYTCIVGAVGTVTISGATLYVAGI